MASTTQDSTGRPSGEHYAVFHCDRCNSDVPVDQLLSRSWDGRVFPSCPNCGNPIAALAERHASVTGPDYGFPVNGISGDELKLCSQCGGAYRKLSFNASTGEVQPVKFCPHCGSPVESGQNLPR